MIPDLLLPEASVRIDLEQTRFAVTLAFAGSTSGGLFAEALDRARVPASHWDPKGFAADLFLPRFVTQYFCIRSGARDLTLTAPSYLLRIVCQPPSDPAVVAFRSAILAELVARPELEQSLSALHRDLGRLRALTEGTGGSRSFDANRQKLDTLATLKQIFDRMASEFETATSGLARLSEFGREVQASEPYRSLGELLSYDQHLATLSLKISVGADGQIRGFDVLSIEESHANPFVNPFWRRWLAKLELFLRGYKFSQAEVLTRLIDSVFSGIDDKLAMVIQVLGDVELYLGALGFRAKAEAAGLAVCLPEVAGADETKELEGLFNPLLFLNGQTAVPCDLVVEPSTSTTLVTGPNSGGKTRLLQSIALAQVLAQSGLFVPARRARVAMVTRLVASLIEGTKADQTEGRLGMEMLRIRDLFERLPPHAMVLLDELCSGTNPSEGERIVELVLGMLHKLRPQAFITSHFLAFAQRLEREGTVPGLSFLQVQLSPERRPTYQFKPGVADSSLAEATAERLGVTGDQLLELVEENVRKHRTATSHGS
ncbi:MAG: DNA mismatch repair protein [Polyangiaceae bacterium]|nr:DNA mismatch repair protein [Polyangiaceae bacterium]